MSVALTFLLSILTGDRIWMHVCVVCLYTDSTRWRENNQTVTIKCRLTRSRRVDHNLRVQSQRSSSLKIVAVAASTCRQYAHDDLRQDTSAVRLHRTTSTVTKHWRNQLQYLPATDTISTCDRICLHLVDCLHSVTDFFNNTQIQKYKLCLFRLFELWRTYTNSDRSIRLLIVQAIDWIKDDEEAVSLILLISCGCATGTSSARRIDNTNDDLTMTDSRVDTALTPSDGNQMPSSIAVTGLPETGDNTERLQKYFSARCRSGGDKIQKSYWDQQHYAFIISFGSNERQYSTFKHVYTIA